MTDEQREYVAEAVASAIADSPMRPDVKKVAVGSMGGIFVLAAAMWTWASAQTTTVARHEELLVGAGKSVSLADKVDGLVRDLAVERQAGNDRDRRLERIENSVDAIGVKVGSKK
jgi:hypothetical protein